MSKKSRSLQELVEEDEEVNADHDIPFNKMYKLCESVTDGVYFASISGLNETEKGDYLILMPFVIYNGKRTPFENVLIKFDDNNTHRSAAGQFLELFGGLSWKQIQKLTIKITISTNEKEGKVYANVTKVEEVDPDELEEKAEKIKSKISHRLVKPRKLKNEEEEEMLEDDEDGEDDEDEEDLFDEEEEQ